MTPSNRPDSVRAHPPRPAPLQRASVAVMAVVLLAGCSTGTGVPMPVPVGGSSATPNPTVSPAPAPGSPDEAADAVDPRCLASYPNINFSGPQYERDLENKPEFWPIVPPFAVYCWGESSDNESIGHYATDKEIVRAEVYRYYEDKFGLVGVHGRVDSDHGELLTGVFPPEHSYFIEHDYVWSTYQITWAIDGDYDDTDY